MSTTTTPEPTAPNPVPPPGGDAPKAAETAPSQILAEGPTAARAVGFGGLFLLVLGLVAIITNEALGPRWIGKGGGFLAAAFGVALMLYHAIRDGEQEVRRLYGLLALVWLVLAVGAGVWPGPVFEAAATKQVGFNLLPYGVGFGFLALLFAVPFVRHETEPKYRDAAVLGMLAVGAALSVGSLAAGVIKPDFLINYGGIVLALLGLGFLCAYMGQTDTSEGIGYRVALLIGVVGAAVAVYAIARAALPTLLYEGPNALRRPNGTLDPWKAAARGLAVLICAGIAALGWASRAPNWVRYSVLGVGLAGAAVLLVAAATNFNTQPVAEMAGKTFLVPGGVILVGLGVVYLAVSLGICSDNQFITLTRRELAAYFLSPIGYLVLGGMAVAEWWGYTDFLDTLKEGRPIQEPILRYYFFSLLPVVAVILEVPALTMRLLAEEKRTGSLEVLLTSPVNETPIVLSKFLGTWIFFLISWVPAGLFLISLRFEADQPFDFRPLLSFYISLAAQGMVFVAMGLFFSSLTRNQIIAAFLSLVGMVFFGLVTYLRSRPTSSDGGTLAFLQVALGRLSFINMWHESLAGHLPVRDVLLLVSMAVFFLFLSVKVLETRKWS